MLENKGLRIIFIVLLLECLSVTVIFQLLPLYVEKMGFSPTLIGFLTAAYSACGIIAMPFLGHWSDRWGRRRVLLFCQMGTFLSILILLVAKTPILIFASVMLDGFTGANYPIVEAYVADVTKPEERIEAFRNVSLVGYLGLVLGPLLAGILAIRGFQLPIMAGALFCLLSILTTYFFLPKSNQIIEPHDNKKKFELNSYFQFFKNAKLSPYFMLYTLFCVAFFFYVSGIALFSEHQFSQDGHLFGEKEVSYVFITIGVYTILYQSLLLGKLQKKWGEVKFINMGFLFAIIGYFFLGLIHQPYLLFLVLLFTVFGNAIIPTTLRGIISKNVSDKQQGTVMSLLHIVRSICQVVMPPIAGAMIERRLLSAWAWTPCIIFIFALFISAKIKTSGTLPSS